MPVRKPTASQKRLEELEEKLRRMQERLDALEARAPSWEVVPPPSPPVREPAPTFVPTKGRPPPATAAAVGRPLRDLERTLGANWLAKAGMLVLVVGVVFFLRYAFQQGWIDRPARIVLGVAGGALLAVLGDVLRRYDAQRFNVYGQVLTGGGASILYFSVFAAHAFPEYRADLGVTLEVDAVLLGATALALSAYSVWQRTPILALESILMGTIASLYSETWIPFSTLYELFLTVAVVGAAAFRRWPLVLLAALGAAYFDLGALLSLDVDPGPVMGVAGAMLVAFTAAAFRFPAPENPRLPHLPLVAALSFLATWGILLAGLDLLQIDNQIADSQFWMGISTAGLAVAALVLSLVPLGPSPSRLGWAVGGILMALAWPPIQFDGVPTALAWTAMAAVLVAVLRFRNVELLRGALLAAGLLLSAHLLFDEAPRIDDGDLTELEGLGVFSLATLVLAGAWFYFRDAKLGRVPLGRVLLGLALAAPLVYFAVALDGYVVSIAWAAEAVLLVVVGFAFGFRDLRLAALALFALVLGRVFIVDIIELSLAVRIITFLVVGGLLLMASFLYARRRQAAAGPRPLEPTESSKPR